MVSGVTTSSRTLRHGRVEIAPGHALAGWGPAGNPRALAEIVRHDPLPAALMIADGHPFAAAATQHQPLQECRALPRGVQARAAHTPDYSRPVAPDGLSYSSQVI